MPNSGVPRGAEGAIRPGRHSEGGGKKGKKRKKKKRKKGKKEKRKKKIREKHVISGKHQMEHFNCGAPVHV